MSFSDLAHQRSNAGGKLSAPAAPPITTRATMGSASTQDFEETMKTIGQKMIAYHRQINQIEKLGSKPMAPLEQWNQNVQTELDTVMRLQGEIAAELSRPPPEAYRTRHKKLAKDFDQIVMAFQRIWVSIDRMRNNPQEEQEDHIAESEGLTLQEIEFKRLDNDVSHHEALIEERNKEIQEIHKSVVEVNELFKDVAHLVAEQDDKIQTIDTYITDAQQKTSQGLAEVQEAAQLQRSCLIQ